MRAAIGRTPWWVYIYTAIFLLAGSTPFLVGLILTPADQIFTGVLYNPADMNSYLANMRQGEQGHWLYVVPYTAERSTPVPLYMVYLLLGHVAHLTGLAVPLVFHLARLFGAALFALTAYHFISQRTRDEMERKLAFALLLFTGGLSLFSVLILNTTEMAAAPDLYISEATSFGSLMVNPHFTFVMSFMVWMMVAAEVFSTTGNWSAALVTLLSGIGIALVHVHQLAVVGVVVGGMWLLRCRKARGILWREGARITAVFAPVMLTAGALVVVTLHDDVLAAWMSNNQMPAPPVWSVAFILYGPLFWLAIAGVVVVFRQREQSLYLTTLWFVVVLVLMYLPVNIQRRFIEGWQIPVILLSAMIWRRSLAPRLAARWTSSAARRLGLITFSCLTLSPILLLAQGLAYVAAPGETFAYLDHDSHQAVQWLRGAAQTSDHDLVVFAGPIHSNVIPAWVMVRTVTGHHLITPSVGDRWLDIKTFFDVTTSQAERIAILERLDVDYVYFGDEEREIGGFDPEDADYLKRVFENTTVAIYQFYEP